MIKIVKGELYLEQKKSRSINEGTEKVFSRIN